MQSKPVQHFTLLDELDARQDDVLGQLDQLNDQIEKLLSEFTRPAVTPVPVPALAVCPPALS